MKILLKILVSLVLLGILTFLYTFYLIHSTEKESVRDTIVVHDTITFSNPVPRDSVVIRYVTEVLPIDSVIMRDSLNIRDSVRVVVPITRKTYSDSTFRAVVSGYHPSLDELTIYKRERVIYAKEKHSRWNIGIQGGYGITPEGMQPYVGVGISYRLFGR